MTDPASRSNPTPKPMPAARVHADLDGVRKEHTEPRVALVVEDSRLIRRTLVSLLQAKGLQVHEAEDGREALVRILEIGIGNLSVIFTDVMMPRMDGPAFLEAARNKYGDALPPVFACSSEADRETIQRMAPLGLAGYIVKPFKNEVLYRKIEALFPELKG